MRDPSLPTLDATAQRRRARWRLMLVGGIVAALYGLFARWFFGEKPAGMDDLFAVMSVAFIFGVPLAIGFLSAVLGRIDNLVSAVIVPWIPALTCLVVALALVWEGLICIFLWLPLFIGLSSLGGLAGWFVVLNAKPRTSTMACLVVALLPFTLSPVEQQFPLPDQTRAVLTSIAIDADAATVWREIASVPAIREEEHSLAAVHLIGFPRPIAATLEGTGVGAVRHATFERGVVFVETIRTWEEGRTLSFSIEADPESIPPTALDEHVTVGGPFFDVLRGTYEIQPAASGVVLRLSSEHRLATQFNGYAGLWTDYIMRATQRYILEIIKRRCEEKT